jgi:hypothetical protein
LGVKRERSQRHVSVIVAFDDLFHVFDFTGRQACRDDSWAAWVIIQIAPGLRAAPLW